MYSGSSNIRTLPVTATWVQNRDRPPITPKDPEPERHRPKPTVGKRTELARYTAAGEPGSFTVNASTGGSG